MCTIPSALSKSNFSWQSLFIIKQNGCKNKDILTNQFSQTMRSTRFLIKIHFLLTKLIHQEERLKEMELLTEQAYFLSFPDHAALKTGFHWRINISVST